MNRLSYVGLRCQLKTSSYTAQWPPYLSFGCFVFGVECELGYESYSAVDMPVYFEEMVEFSFILLMAWLRMLVCCPEILLPTIYLVALPEFDCMCVCIGGWVILLVFWKRYFLLPLFSFLSFSFSLRS